MDFFLKTSGTWINFFTVIVGTLLGMVLGGRIPERMNHTLMQVLAVTTLYISIDMGGSLGGLKIGILPGIIAALVCLALGAVIGELLQLEERLGTLGETLKQKFKGKGRFTEGFVTASLLFCIGPMTVIGSLQNGLQQDPNTLILKATLDGIAAVALTGVYGMGVGFSAIVVLIVQGILSLAAGGLATALPSPATDPSVLLITGTGGLMITGISFNLLFGSFDAPYRVRVGSFLPALVLAPLLVGLMSLFK
ncbi:DUF554 domain-containing protein [Deinococcus roseus]|uniref:DUF554 domain-containing protein n=1 Tax=Deinococcus roseus TaxID=392414 RepID=A0ABQ2CUN3_9DEIO|nr:DUF554 domain-containing protein [Deinococcus roseus]GGJ21074.1 hypothetical protein GCM10008938_04130 [Deinococcus roseus]